MHRFDTRGLVLALGLMMAAGTAVAAQAPAAGTESGKASVEVTGFRSAKFGMSEQDVRAAMTKDFKLTPADIKEAENPVEHTKVLQAVVTDLLPGGGKAEIAYVFGYKTHTRPRSPMCSATRPTS